ncbi:hypothetical protein B0T17DRAFT_543709 [Bombardia bombarda]|uniref:Uncharacterized protein n=1 Tax=Bombardia bombarda TaxID=252184 RepID=A0AA39T295_9PEZI|nr:hypothetical protein B0T17DRAFT_543709 [Bombardia bombarda]
MHHAIPTVLATLLGLASASAAAVNPRDDATPSYMSSIVQNPSETPHAHPHSWSLGTWSKTGTWTPDESKTDTASHGHPTHPPHSHSHSHNQSDNSTNAAIPRSESESLHTLLAVRATKTTRAPAAKTSMRARTTRAAKKGECDNLNTGLCATLLSTCGCLACQSSNAFVQNDTCDWIQDNTTSAAAARPGLGGNGGGHGWMGVLSWAFVSALVGVLIAAAL